MLNKLILVKILYSCYSGCVTTARGMAFFSQKTGSLKRKASLFLSVFFLSVNFIGQTQRIDSLEQKLVNATDTLRPFLLNKIAEEINDNIFSFPKARQDSLLHFAKSCVTEAEALSRQLNYHNGIGMALFFQEILN